MSRESHLAALRDLMPAIFARYGIYHRWERVFLGLRWSEDAVVAQAHRCYAAIERSIR